MCDKVSLANSVSQHLYTRKTRCYTDGYLTKLIGALCKVYGKHQNMYLDNLYMLNQDIRYIGWAKLAQMLKLPKKSLYNWYVDTYTRKLSTKMTPEDRQLIKDAITNACLHGISMDRNYQRLLKQQLSYEYNRSEFSIVYNNELRKTKKTLTEQIAIQDIITLLATQSYEELLPLPVN